MGVGSGQGSCMQDPIGKGRPMYHVKRVGPGCVHTKGKLRTIFDCVV